MCLYYCKVSSKRIQWNLYERVTNKYPYILINFRVFHIISSTIESCNLKNIITVVYHHLFNRFYKYIWTILKFLKPFLFILKKSYHLLLIVFIMFGFIITRMSLSTETVMLIYCRSIKSVVLTYTCQLTFVFRMTHFTHQQPCVSVSTKCIIIHLSFLLILWRTM